MNATDRDRIARAIDELVEIAFRLGLNPPDVRFEVVPRALRLRVTP